MTITYHNPSVFNSQPTELHCLQALKATYWQKIIFSHSASFSAITSISSEFRHIIWYTELELMELLTGRKVCNAWQTDWTSRRTEQSHHIPHYVVVSYSKNPVHIKCKSTTTAKQRNTIRARWWKNGNGPQPACWHSLTCAIYATDWCLA